MRACVCETKKDGQRRRRETLESLDKRAREIPPTPLIFPPFPIIPSLNHRERNIKAHTRKLNCIWVKPKQHHHIRNNTNLLS